MKRLDRYVGRYVGLRAVGSAGSGWPLGMPGLRLFLDRDLSTLNTAEDGSGLPPGPGDPVRRWVDKASGIVFSRPTLNPDYSASPPGVLFTAAATDQLEGGAASDFSYLHQAAGASLFISATKNSDVEAVLLDNFNINVTTVNPGLGLRWLADGRISAPCSSDDGGAVFEVTSTLGHVAADGRAQFMIAHEEVSPGNYEADLFHPNGVDSASGLGSYATGDPAFNAVLGRRRVTGAMYFDGVIHRVLAFDRRLSQADYDNLVLWDEQNP